MINWTPIDIDIEEGILSKKDIATKYAVSYQTIYNRSKKLLHPSEDEAAAPISSRWEDSVNASHPLDVDSPHSSTVKRFHQLIDLRLTDEKISPINLKTLVSAYKELMLIKMGDKVSIDESMNFIEELVEDSDEKDLEREESLQFIERLMLRPHLSDVMSPHPEDDSPHSLNDDLSLKSS